MQDLPNTPGLSADDLIPLVHAVGDGQYVTYNATWAQLLAGNAATASALFSNPSPCPSGRVVTDIAASGVLTCSQLNFSDLAGQLNFSDLAGSLDFSALTGTLPAHAASHQDGGADEIATATPTAYGIPKAGADGVLDSGWLPPLPPAGVTSVGNGTIGALFSASWSNPTTTPTLDLDLATAAAHAFLAGPTSGAPAVPTARAIVASDVPTLNQDTTGSAAHATTADSATAAGDGLSSASGTAPLTLSLAAKALTGSVAAASTSATGVVQLATPSSDTTAGHAVQASDARLSDARTPTAHAASHQNGGSDEVATATAAANAIPKAGAGGTLSSAWIPTLNQNTTGSAAKWTTARTIAGNSVDGSANVTFANKFVVQGTTDSGLSAAQFLGALGTGIVKNTTSTGVLSIAVAGDFPTLNQSTTGSAATLTTARSIYGNSFDGSADLSQIIASTYGGTGNGFFKVSGPASSEKTFTIANASGTIPTDGGAVTDKAVPTWSGTDGKTLQDNSGVTIPSAGTVQSATVQGGSTAGAHLTIRGSSNASAGDVEATSIVAGVHGSGTSSTQGSIIVPAGVSTDYRPALVFFQNQTIPDSITRSGSTATITMTNNPGFGGATYVATIAGADQAEYNGTFVFTRSSCGSPCVYTFTVAGSPATPATGNIVAGKSGFSLEDASAAMGGSMALMLTANIFNFSNSAITGSMGNTLTGGGTAYASTGTTGGLYFGTYSAAGAFTTQAAITPPSSGVVSCDTSSAGNGQCEFQQGTDTVKTANGSTWKRGSTSESLTLSTGGTTTDTSANLLPADCYIEAVVARVTTTITTATNWKLGDSTTAGRFTAADSTMTAGETKVGLVHRDQTGAAGPIQSAAAKVRVTTTGTPGAGVIRITSYWSCFVAPTS